MSVKWRASGRRAQRRPFATSRGDPFWALPVRFWRSIKYKEMYLRLDESVSQAKAFLSKRSERGSFPPNLRDIFTERLDFIDESRDCVCHGPIRVEDCPVRFDHGLQDVVRLLFLHTE